MDISEAKTGVRIRVRGSFNAVVSDPPVINGLVMYQFGEEPAGAGAEKPERCAVIKDEENK